MLPFLGSPVLLNFMPFAVLLFLVDCRFYMTHIITVLQWILKSPFRVFDIAHVCIGCNSH